MARMKFGAFLAPHHPLGEHPTLQLQRDLQLVQHLDQLGFDEFWCGEHHSSGWEMIGSPELFLAAAGERTHRIMLGTGVVSLPYHHPFNVAQRIVQLDHLTRGRVIFGTGPGALPSDAWTLGIDPMKQRDRQDEALGVIIRLLRGEGRFSVESEWFTLRDAQLQILPLQEDMQMVAASSISPSGMQIAGKYGIGVISIASTSSEGLQALPTQWSFAEEAAAKNGTSVDRKNWRVLMSWHLAESRKQAEKEAKYGLQRWHNEYNVRVLGRPGAKRVEDPDELVAQIAGRGAEGTGAAVVGTPDELVASIRELRDVTGGFGAVIGFAHDWADREATLRSWELFARFVAPEINGYTASQKASAQFLVDNQKQLMGGAAAAVMAKIAGNEKAAAAMAVTMKRMQEQPQGGEWRPGAAPTEVAVEGQDSNGKSPSS
jgi:limonene 1,2-monooxygenase